LLKGEVSVFQVKSVEFWYLPLFSTNELYALVKNSTTPAEFANTTAEELKNTCFFCTGTSKDEGYVHTYGMRRELFVTKYSLRHNRKGIIDWYAKNSKFTNVLPFLIIKLF